MVSTFDLGKLKNLLRDFYSIAHIRITVFDDSFQELAAYPEDVAPLCQVIRQDPSALEKCRACDREACQIAAGRHTSYTYTCHAGLTESISPLYLGNIVIGYLFFGHVFAYPTHEEGWNVIRERCRAYEIDQETLKTAVYGSVLTDHAYIDSAANILQAVASYLCLERMVSIRQKDISIEIDEYISAHFTEAIDVPSLCDTFEIGKTSLYEIAKRNYGKGIAEHIRELRIEKAKTLLLEEPQTAVSEIADKCGFDDYNYFITVFKRLTGLPPGKYRAEADRM